MAVVATAKVVRLACTRKPASLRASSRTAAVAHDFGVAPWAERVVLPAMRVSIGPGQIVAFTGPSGSGKSTALRLIERQCPLAFNVGRVKFPEHRALVDGVAPRGTLGEALEVLSLCALGEVPLWLRSFEELSDGEQFRARLARALGAAADRAGGILITDEFASGLHRRAAKAMAYNLRKLATRRGLSMVVATSHGDILADLQADTCGTLRRHGGCRVVRQVPRNKPISLWRRLRITKGTKGDYHAFAKMHYRSTDELGFVDKVFVLREGAGGEPVAIVVYAYGPAELTLRNEVTGGRFKRNLERLNRELRILRRLVVHPDLRGCGVGHRFVRRTLPMVGARFVECLASMGSVNPVFERAGMRRIGVCAAPRKRQGIVERLRALEVDPFGPDFEVQVCRRAGVRALVAELVTDWYQATTATGEHRVARQSPKLLAQIFRGLVGSRPVYYLWENKAKG